MHRAWYHLSDMGDVLLRTLSFMKLHVGSSETNLQNVLCIIGHG